MKTPKPAGQKTKPAKGSLKGPNVSNRAVRDKTAPTPKTLGGRNA